MVKIPQKPPPSEQRNSALIEVLNDPAKQEALGRMSDSYLHWDDLRRRPTPDGITHVMWWAILKFSRSLQRRATPLVDVSGRAFAWSWNDKIVDHLNRIDLMGGGTIGVGEAVLNQDAKTQYYVSSLITEATTSSQLEGASTTREVARDMLLTKRKPRDHSEKMIFNNYLTMERISSLRDSPFSPELVFELHALVTSDTLAKPDAAGRFRRADEDIAVVDNDGQILHQPPSPETLPDRLRALCDFANGVGDQGFVHPVMRAIIIHFWLAWDHPFVDGNGRTARALFYWSMLRSRYWLFEYISISEIILRAPVKYGRAFLLTETDDNDLTYFVLYHLEVIREALDALQRFISQKSSEVRALDSVLRSAADQFNHRQRELLGHALRHPTQVYTIAGHQARQGVVYQTARTDLLGLAEAGFLVRGEQGKKLVFRPVKDLERKLRKLGIEAG